MNHLILNTDATLAWNGTPNDPVDTRNHLYVSFDAVATVDIADGDVAAFVVQYAPPSDADPCVPGAFVDIPEVGTCVGAVDLADNSEFLIAGPIAAGTRCKFTVACPGRGYLQIIAGTGGSGAVEADFNVFGLTQMRR